MTIIRTGIILTVSTLLSLVCAGQGRTLSYQSEIGGAASGNRLPFWLYSNNYGKIMPDSYLWGNVGLFSDFHKKNTRAFDFALGAEGTGSLDKDENRIFVNQLYGRVRWQNLLLDLGMVNRKIIYDGLSSTNGDMLFSTNSRSLPGISLSTWDYIKLPYIGQWLAFKAKYAEYTMTDKRFMGSRTRLHNKLLGIRITPIPQISVEGGIEDYAQWGGSDPVNGKVPSNFKNYVRMVLIKEGSSDASASDQINKLGNHLGMHFAKVRYDGRTFGAELYYNHMFEDGSGMRFRNAPDGLYGIYVTRKNGSKWFKSFLYELNYTKSQSGRQHDRPATPEEIEAKDPNDPYQDRIILGGNDDYLNHGEYQSGWTFHGRTIGAPFFTPAAENAGGMTLGIYNSRFVAHHLGICGDLPGDIRYKLLFSYSENYGRYSAPFVDEQGQYTSKPQFSFGAEFIAPESKIPFNTSLSVGFDKGDLLKNNFGVMLKIFKTGIFWSN